MNPTTQPSAFIFGAGTGGTKAFHFYRRQYRIVAFADNDAIKQTQRFHGLPVVAPRKLVESTGKVIIGSQYFPAISQQLMTAGVDPARIVVADPEILEGLYLPMPGLKPALAVLALLLGLAAFGAWKLIAA